MLVFFIYQYSRMKRKLNALEPVTDMGIVEIGNNVKAAMHMKKNFRLLVGEKAILFGITSPIIVIPIDQSEENMEMIFRHEFTHYKYKDHLISYILLVALIIHWFNPLVWMAINRIKEDMEFACDERVLDSGISKQQYAMALLHNTLIKREKSYLVHSMGENKEQTKKRILYIANLKKPKRIISILIGIVIIGIGIVCLTNPPNNTRSQEEATLQKDTENGLPITDNLNLSKESISIALLGVDESLLRTDTIMVATLSTSTNAVKVVHVPRDTRIEWDEEQQALAKKASDREVSISKLNQMLVYGSTKNIRPLLLKEVERLVQQKIDYYVLIQPDTVDQLVDAMGGIRINVPVDMFYEDPYQGLKIDLKKGEQLLNGSQVQQLIRFRMYAEGDLGRIAMQQQVIKEAINWVADANHLDKLPEMIKMISKVNTDMGLSDLVEYIPLLSKIDLSKIELSVVPGEGKYIDNISYFIPDGDK